MLLQTFSSFVIQAEYLLNKSYIAAVLCENKDKPMMHCNGKCYLSKQLKKQEKQEQNAPNGIMKKMDAQPFFLPAPLEFEMLQPSTKQQYYLTADFYSSATTGSIFRPPTI